MEENLFINPQEYYEKKELIELTRELIKIPSHKDVLHQEKEIAAYINEFFNQHHIDSVLHPVVDERSNVIARIMGNGTGRSLMYNGHTDTVLPYNMTIEPFAAEIRDGCIWGRGAVDMKGSLAAFMMAMIVIKRSDFVPGGDVIFTGVIGEEGKSEGTEYIIKSDIRADAAIVGEPSDYEYAVGHRGLEWFDVIFRGKSSHSGRPDKGINAIEMAMTFIQRVKQDLYPILKEKYDEYAGESVMNYGTIIGGTEQSTVADQCMIRLDRRYIPGETRESVMEEYQNIIDVITEEEPAFSAEIRVTPESLLELYHPPLITSVNEPIVTAVRESIKDVILEEPSITRGIGWSDAGLLKTYADIPTVVFGPGDLSLAHTEEEHIDIDDLVNFVEIYTRLIQRFTTMPLDDDL